MQVFQWIRAKSVRAMCFALFLCLIPASSWAGVFISVGFAPPPLPVVVMADQPPCPQPGWMWTPGYWAYGADGYYWVPGTWVPAPEPDLYWTPGYWGWSTGLYVWHPGYWGPSVGYYGGVNYGFGYFGIGFVGGMWHGGVFAYNTAVLRVNSAFVHNVYMDRAVIGPHTVAMNSRVSFSGGPGGIHHPPTAAARAAMSQHHFAASPVQTQHEAMAGNDRSAYFNNNHGNPSHLAMARPAGGNTRGVGAVNYNSSKSNTGAQGVYHPDQPRSNSGNANRGPRSMAVNPPDGLDRTSRGSASGNQSHSQQSRQPASHGSQQAPPRNDNRGHR